MTSAGDLRERVAFSHYINDPTINDPNAAPGVTKPDWIETHVCRAQFLLGRASEAVEAARLQGQTIYKVKIRQCAAARAITTDHRMIDVRRGTKYAITGIDAIADRSWVFVQVMSGRDSG